MDNAWIGSIDVAMKKAYTSRAFEIETKELAKHSHSGIMSETQVVSGALGNLHSGIRRSTTPEGGSLLEELRTAYQGLGREQRQRVKSLLLTLLRSVNSAGFRPSEQKSAQPRIRCPVYSHYKPSLLNRELNTVRFNQPELTQHRRVIEWKRSDC